MSNIVIKSKGIIISTIIVGTLTLGGCTSKPDIPVVKDQPIKIETQEVKVSKEEQERILNANYDLLTTETDPKVIFSFIDENIGKLDEEGTDELIIGLEEFLKADLKSLLEEYNKANEKPELFIYPTIDYSNLKKYNDYLSNEMRSYIEINSIESEHPFTDGDMIQIPIAELLSRAQMAERHLIQYKEGRMTKKTYELYVSYIDAILVGTGNPLIYANEGKSTIREDVVKDYKDFIEANKDSRTAELLKEYIEILGKNNNDLNSENVIKYHEDRYSSYRTYFEDLGL